MLFTLKAGFVNTNFLTGLGPSSRPCLYWSRLSLPITYLPKFWSGVIYFWDGILLHWLLQIPLDRLDFFAFSFLFLTIIAGFSFSGDSGFAFFFENTFLFSMDFDIT